MSVHKTLETKEKSKSFSASVRIRLRECVHTEFVWEFNRGFEKATASRAVRLRESLLNEVCLYIVFLLAAALKEAGKLLESKVYDTLQLQVNTSNVLLHLSCCVHCLPPLLLCSR